MIHPLFSTLATRPELLVEHLGAYAQLARVEAGDAGALLRERARLMLLLCIGLALGTGLGGAALLLLAAVPLQQMPAPWLLALVPALPLGLALYSGLRLRQQDFSGSFALLRQQFAFDTRLLREAGDH